MFQDIFSILVKLFLCQTFLIKIITVEKNDKRKKLFIFLWWRKAELLFLLSTTIALNREKCFAHTHNTRSEKKYFHCLHKKSKYVGKGKREMRHFERDLKIMIFT